MRNTRRLAAARSGHALRLSVLALALLALSSGRITAQSTSARASADKGIQSPEQYFGFKIGADGELARYPKILEYFQLLAKQTDRIKYEELGKTTMGNSYPLLRDQLAGRTWRISIGSSRSTGASPIRAGLSEAEAQKLAAEGKPFYFIYATIHSTEVSNGQAIINIVHRLATSSDRRRSSEILDNSVVLMVPSQNPDGQVLVIDHWYKTKGTPFQRVYPDLYHKYVGHDDNRDWFMFTQKETRMNVEMVQNKYKPIITHDMHQQGGNGARIFVPPFTEPFDPNMHPLLRRAGDGRPGDGGSAVGGRQGRRRVGGRLRHVVAGAPVHGLPRPAAHPHRDRQQQPRRSGRRAANGQPLGRQESRAHFPVPYSKDTWTLGQQVDYGVTVAFAGMADVAKYGTNWLMNFYRVHATWSNGFIEKNGVRTRSSSPPSSAIPTASTRCSTSCSSAPLRFIGPPRRSARTASSTPPDRG